MASSANCRNNCSPYCVLWTGAYDKNVEYISIIGTGVTGSLGGLGRAATAKVAASIDVVATKDESATKESASLGDRFQSLVAFSSYSVLCGEGENVLGDGKFSEANLRINRQAQIDRQTDRPCQTKTHNIDRHKDRKTNRDKDK